MTTPEIYKLSKQRLVELGTTGLFVELTGHLPCCGYFPNGLPKTPKFPESFYVKIYPDDNDDTNGIQYFTSLEEEQPFLVMGFSDTGFCATMALFRCAGERQQ
jgi:hypothetical protein